MNLPSPYLEALGRAVVAECNRVGLAPAPTADDLLRALLRYHIQLERALTERRVKAPAPAPAFSARQVSRLVDALNLARTGCSDVLWEKSLDSLERELCPEEPGTWHDPDCGFNVTP